ncbi:polysaccharide pyruvyl transferase family protein [Sporolactobacillus vineae]|uniref:polysaccharide pyruvyl transferase family protein n=1 Tax=Sporolactobacillus vineae TaxID=444463 RepID=UPI00028A3CC3|nr:polysaccharide pyruvyl transferase family protein [Sporolactobacillus vineae]
MFDAIKQKIPNHIKIYYNGLKYMRSNKYKLKKSERKIIVAMAADYGNLGDVAITYSQLKLLKHMFPLTRIVTFPMSDIYHYLLVLKHSCSESDIITLIGGGNMSDLYEYFEESRREIVKMFPKNTIISFPQTIDFSSTKKGGKSLRNSINVYSRHRDLHIFAREPKSFDIMKKYFKKNDIQLVPDIVLTLNETAPKMQRSGLLLCLRNDEESIVNDKEKSKLVEILNKTFKNVYKYDTHIGDEQFMTSSPKKELNKIWMAFRKSKIVITDRLHGMIFCAITKTPCIVLPNSNHKITSSFNKWLKDLGYIYLIDNINADQILNKIKDYENIDSDDYQIHFDNYFAPLFDLLKNLKNN